MREVEAALDALDAGFDAALFQRAHEALKRHYASDEPFLAIVQRHEPHLAGKLRAQHDEALEIAQRIEESLAAGDSRDIDYLLRRFLAIARHNLIEEERDVLPLARRWLQPGEGGVF